MRVGRRESGEKGIHGFFLRLSQHASDSIHDKPLSASGILTPFIQGKQTSPRAGVFSISRLALPIFCFCFCLVFMLAQLLTFNA